VFANSEVSLLFRPVVFSFSALTVLSCPTFDGYPQAIIPRWDMGDGPSLSVANIVSTFQLSLSPGSVFLPRSPGPGCVAFWSSLSVLAWVPFMSFG